MNVTTDVIDKISLEDLRIYLGNNDCNNVIANIYEEVVIRCRLDILQMLVNEFYFDVTCNGCKPLMLLDRVCDRRSANHANNYARGSVYSTTSAH